MRYARETNDIIVEVIDLPADLVPAKVFAADIAALFFAVAADVEPHFVRDGGGWVAPAPIPEDLDALKLDLKAQVDASAERERGRHITPGAGQAMTYQQKASEAVMLEDDPDPQPGEYPLLSAEVGITAPTLAEVGAIVRTAHGQWILLGAAIEATRLGAKKAIEQAGTPEAARAAAVVAWPG